MAKLPVLSGKEVIKALSKIGFKIVRTRGSHVILSKQTENSKLTIPVPFHPELAKGTLKSIIKQAELDLEEFIKLL